MSMAVTLPPRRVLDALAFEYDVDWRSLVRELRDPGIVRGRAGDRARRAIEHYRASLRSGLDYQPRILPRHY